MRNMKKLRKNTVKQSFNGVCYQGKYQFGISAINQINGGNICECSFYRLE